MSRFLTLDRLDAYESFGVVLTRLRLSMQRAYDAAFESHARCTQLLKEHLWGSVPRLEPLGFPLFGAADEPDDAPDREALDAIWLEAIAEDYQSDLQAGLVILAADDLLQRFGRRIANAKVLFDPGFGPTYRGFGEVRLTTLLHAGTNALRHVSEWDDIPDLQRLPYPKLAELPEGSKLYDAIRNIEVIQRAFGIGFHELIRQPVSSRVLVLVDGHLGTAEPDYRRFEAAIIDAAAGIARHARGQHLAKLNKVLKRMGHSMPEPTL